ncbi:Mrp8p NDAI_0C03750 [Naumovozyma dairenensis CBS 421]|uniref:Mrp8p n=1 Tax=Naumovozyma dairenensis (strain ATCC 10597 / BCRC 20456 / CBS 421 / NBRC 0211 / NRRL Y-12639) TaxID=1071378 RepID=G0W8C4_NAUDC|nr:hypothetical protein NDAI_0C03750 [Naumovozyma dairenensis CBS 421]CCD24035.1 hypothetical protein NDAI_0C03750 [Naumovozyma dairenensis CBS 421]
MTTELEQLKKKVNDLEALVKKQTLLISTTGKNVMQLQLNQQRNDVQKFDETFNAKNNVPPIDPTDFATNGDLVELVAELQGELNRIEERSIRRVVNSTKLDGNDTLAPMPNPDGEIPSLEQKDWFPISLSDFENIPDVKLYKLAKFYERLPEKVKEEEDYENLLKRQNETVQINDLDEKEIMKELKKFSEEEINEMFNEVARFLGVRSRRGTNIW